MISLTQLRQKLLAIKSNKWIWIGLGFAAGLAMHTYYVQEMLAALIIFSVLFVGAYIAGLAVFLLFRASKPIIAWAKPNVLRAVEWGVDTVQGVIANHGWTRAVPHRFPREEPKLNVKYKLVYSRFASLKPIKVYRVGLHAGRAALNVGLSAQKKMSRRLGNWLTQRVTYSDLIHLASMFQVRLSTRRYRRVTSGH